MKFFESIQKQNVKSLTTKSLDILFLEDTKFQIEILGYQDKKERKERKKDIVNTGKNTRIEKF